jgi:Transposase DDE domain/Transposase domain (DUF772)
MRSLPWCPPIELTSTEQQVIQRIRRAKFFVFLRKRRHELLDEAFQQELAGLYGAGKRGHPPVAPALLVLAMLLQAYTGISDDEVIEATTMDRRWQLVLGCMDCREPPFSKGTLVAFRQRLIHAQMDRRLLERTLEVAPHPGVVGKHPVRAALDSSPLWGASRVEDTYNLLGHALRKALGIIAAQQGRALAELAAEASAQVVSGTSLKAALDCDWDHPQARQKALQVVLAALTAVESWVETQPDRKNDPGVQANLQAAQQIKEQDVAWTETGTATLRTGVAKDRRISIEDGQMRHGRKSRSVRVDGYKRHVFHDLDTGLVRAVGITSANVAEALVTEALGEDLLAQHVTLQELHIDRAYLSSSWVRDRSDKLVIYCKAWPIRNSTRFPKTAFELDWEQQRIRCPNQHEVAFQLGKTVQFPSEICANCPLRDRCTTSARGRSVHIHPDEALLGELRQRQVTPAGRAKLRERVAVEHTLAHLGHWQGPRARYRGERKNLFDLRRCAVVHNLHVLARSQPVHPAA